MSPLDQHLRGQYRIARAQAGRIAHLNPPRNHVQSHPAKQERQNDARDYEWEVQCRRSALPIR
eukprot:3665808-Rhodomonas_salina.1